MDRADELLAEGRDRVRSLRMSRQEDRLPRALKATAERLRLDLAPSVQIDVRVEGIEYKLHPVVFDEVAGVAGEALFNAFAHARPRLVTVEIRYERRYLVVCVRDDGIGMDPALLREGRQGHFGLVGMRERARKVSADLVVDSRLDQGTEVVMTICGWHAYLHRRWLRTAARRLAA